MLQNNRNIIFSVTLLKSKSNCSCETDAVKYKLYKLNTYVHLPNFAETHTLP